MALPRVKTPPMSAVSSAMVKAYPNKFKKKAVVPVASPNVARYTKRVG